MEKKVSLNKRIKEFLLKGQDVAIRRANQLDILTAWDGQVYTQEKFNKAGEMVGFRITADKRFLDWWKNALSVQAVKRPSQSTWKQSIF